MQVKSKYLSYGYKSKYGRNHSGRITSRRRGGGNKRLLRLVDFSRQNTGNLLVKDFWFHSRKKILFALVRDESTGFFSYITKTQNIKKHDVLINDSFNDSFVLKQREGSCTFLKKILIGSLVHCVEFKPHCGFKAARAAGASAQIIAKTEKAVILRLPSGKTKELSNKVKGVYGVVSDKKRFLHKTQKAGQTRWAGKRPHVRGVAINPVDHPHGGGEGRSSGGRVSVSPWGKYTKGIKTKNKNA